MVYSKFEAGYERKLKLESSFFFHALLSSRNPQEAFIKWTQREEAPAGSLVMQDTMRQRAPSPEFVHFGLLYDDAAGVKGRQVYTYDPKQTQPLLGSDNLGLSGFSYIIKQWKTRKSKLYPEREEGQRHFQVWTKGESLGLTASYEEKKGQISPNTNLRNVVWNGNSTKAKLSLLRYLPSGKNLEMLKLLLAIVLKKTDVLINKYVADKSKYYIFIFKNPLHKTQKTLKNKSNWKNPHFHIWTNTTMHVTCSRSVPPKNPEDHRQRI